MKMTKMVFLFKIIWSEPPFLIFIIFMHLFIQINLNYINYTVELSKLSWKYKKKESYLLNEPNLDY